MTMLDTIERETETSEMPIIEPELIDCPFINGGAVAFADGVLMFTGWLGVTDSGYPERRIKVRFAMSAEAALKLSRSLGAELSQRYLARN